MSCQLHENLTLSPQNDERGNINRLSMSGSNIGLEAGLSRGLGLKRHEMRLVTQLIDTTNLLRKTLIIMRHKRKFVIDL